MAVLLSEARAQPTSTRLSADAHPNPASIDPAMADKPTPVAKAPSTPTPPATLEVIGKKRKASSLLRDPVTPVSHRAAEAYREVTKVLTMIKGIVNKLTLKKKGPEPSLKELVALLGNKLNEYADLRLVLDATITVREKVAVTATAKSARPPVTDAATETDGLPRPATTDATTDMVLTLSWWGSGGRPSGSGVPVPPPTGAKPTGRTSAAPTAASKAAGPCGRASYVAAAGQPWPKAAAPADKAKRPPDARPVPNLPPTLRRGSPSPRG